MNTLVRTAPTLRRLSLLPAVITIGTVVMASPAIAVPAGSGYGSGNGSQRDKNTQGAQGNESQNKTHHTKRNIAHVRSNHSPIRLSGVQQLNSNSGVTALQAAFCKKRRDCRITQNYWVGHM
ncbi:hypothetical protein Psi02_37970 [Planotetraspora silvatica]|uniref:Uncharacterized protein n=1 Tax=Planotetraspora silvatica TaxID=234614 RepID=A0A8J3XSJ7_9ACTN|nr:hypothetical protein [Planotetraspora silvatica]GII47373.1 hypothetical protein Psi02_37970 [Planotetraspora silvatica]